jgi:hypothetical protein
MYLDKLHQNALRHSRDLCDLVRCFSDAFHRSTLARWGGHYDDAYIANLVAPLSTRLATTLRCHFLSGRPIAEAHSMYSMLVPGGSGSVEAGVKRTLTVQEPMHESCAHSEAPIGQAANIVAGKVPDKTK